MKKNQQRDREHAIKSYLKGESITAIARKLGYSRPWVYKWVERYRVSAEHEDWQGDQLRIPHSNPRQLPAEVVAAVKLVRQDCGTRGCSAGLKRLVGSWKLCKLRRCRACVRSVG